MLRGLLHLTWLEMKIFAREPLGLIGSVALPVILFVLMGRLAGPGSAAASSNVPAFVSVDLPIFASILISTSAVLSLIAIVAIYRESGILKRLRATPLRPMTILTAHVIVKLVFTAGTLVLMVAVGRRYYPMADDAPLISFTVALVFCTFCILSLGFLIASLVPTARFAQPAGTLIMYPMLALSGLFIAVDSLPFMLQAVSRVLPLTHATSLLRGVWHGAGWGAHTGDVVALVVTFIVCSVLSARLFRWE